MADNTDKDTSDKETPEEKAPEKDIEKEVPEEVETKEPEKETPETKEPEKEPETKEEETEEEIDVDEITKTAAEQAQKAVMEKIAAGLGLTKDEKDKAQDEGLVPPWEKRGETKPKSWKEHAEYSADLAEWKRKEDEKQIAKVQEEQEQEAKEVNKKWNDYWDSELKELTESNLIPEIKDGSDPNDQGKKVRVRLFAKMKEIGEQRVKENLPPITSVELVFHKFKDEILNEPAGANAPVSFSQRVGGGNKDDYSYAEIHGKSFDQLKEG